MIDGLHKAFESRVRLGIMAVLTVNDQVEHGTMKELLNVTDGNLASHMAALLALKYVQVKKRFIGNRPNTAYKTTPAGTKAFKDHLDAMDRLLKKDLRQ